MFILQLKYLYYFLLFHMSFSALIDDVYEHFKEKDCILGYLYMESSETKIIPQGEIENYEINQVNHLIEKEALSPLSKLEELATFNDLRYVFKLIKEEGPPHKKHFTVSLDIGKEYYEGSGKSLKEAKKSAATVALHDTKYLEAPLKIKNDAVTPTVKLNNVANYLGRKVTYTFIDKKMYIISNQSKKKLNHHRKNQTYLFDQVLNDNIEEDDQQTGPFTVEVLVGEKTYFGSAVTKQAAKHLAAEIALKDLEAEVIRRQTVCSENALSEECQISKDDSLKSPISLIYEAAQKRNMRVSFKIIEEKGKDHKKEFVTECTLDSYVTHGSGKSKQASKHAAAENMMKNLQNLSPLPTLAQLNSKTTKPKKKKNMVERHSFLKNAMYQGISYLQDFVDSVTPSDSENKEDQDQQNTDKTTKPFKRHFKYIHDKFTLENLLQIAQLNDIEIKFVDAGLKNDLFHSLLILEADKPYLCLGKALTRHKSQLTASFSGMRLLFDLGFPMTSLEKLALLESDCDATMTKPVLLVETEDLNKE